MVVLTMFKNIIQELLCVGNGKTSIPREKAQARGMWIRDAYLPGFLVNDPEFECVVDVMLVVGHNHLGGLEYEEIKEIRLLTWRQSEEAEAVGQPSVLSLFPGVRGPQVEPPGSVLLPFSLVSVLQKWGVGRAMGAHAACPVQ